MKREILFRGKGVHSEEWVYGDLIHGVGERHGMISILPITKNLAGIPYCDPLDGVYVDPDTVGQFSGELDRNRQRVFEGDVIRIGSEREYYEVRFLHGCFLAFDGDKQVGLIGELQHCYIEVIGTIHDKIELPV